MKTNMKQYNQEDINKITSVKSQDNMVKDTQKLEIPQVETEERTIFKHEQLHEAMMFTQDVMERALLPFMALQDTALALVTEDLPKLEGTDLHFGVLHPIARSTQTMLTDLLKSWTTDLYIDENVITFKVKKVPVIIDIIHGDYPFFKNLDFRWYYSGEFKIPAPFEEYWKWKDQVK